MLIEIEKNIFINPSQVLSIEIDTNYVHIQLPSYKVISIFCHYQEKSPQKKLIEIAEKINTACQSTTS